MYGNSENITCQSPKHSNATNFIANAYEGIPETFLLNVITWFLLLFLFALLRNRAWDYGRLALVHNEKWTHLFYKNTDEAVVVKEEVSDSSLHADNNCCSWFSAVFKIDRQRVHNRCGPDAFHYLSFQRHLLMLSTIITLVALCIILPVNFQGTLGGDARTFAHTTVSNLDPNSKWLWIHVGVAFAFVPLTILIMRRCSSRIPSATPLSSRTVMVTHISRNHRNVDEIRSYFSERYRNIEIKDVQVPYKIRELSEVEQERERVRRAKVVCVIGNNDMKVQPYGCIVCCPWNTKDALDYYTAEEERLNALVEDKLRIALQNPIGMAFITVSSEEEARYIVNSFVPGTRFHWTVTKSPAPSDIIWENLQVSSRNWYSKAFLINFMLFIILFFLTTPAVVVSILNSKLISSDDVVDKVTHPLIAEFLPTLILLTVSGIMPVIVAYSDQWMSHWTKSEQNFATMQKTFYFLLFMVLILPSLGLTSAQAMLEWSVQKNRTYQWECVFLPDKGAFFVNYVITSALIGTALELLRFPELAMYVWRLLLAKSPAEKTSIQKEILSEFPFGIHYAWTLLIFTTSTVYSTICPLITPFGLLYLCLKHLVDKHNLFFVYGPSSMCGEGQKIHTTAVRIVRLSAVLLQVIMIAFAIVRGGFKSTMSIVTMVGLVTTCIFFCIIGPFPSCKPSSPTVNNFATESQEQYVAPVLKKLLDDVTTQEHVPYACTYGSSTVYQLEQVPNSRNSPTVSI